MKEIIDLYQQMSSGFEESIQERTPDEISYDNVIIKELKKGRSIKKAIKAANKEYPKEALQYDKDSITDIASHYDYLLNHESIKNNITGITINEENKHISNQRTRMHDSGDLFEC